MAATARRQPALSLWMVRPKALPGDVLSAVRAAWMNDEERQREARLLFERHRVELVATRGLVRGVLGDALDEAPGGLVFREGPHGKPSIDAAGLSFNASNCQELVVCVVADGRDVGIDVEPLSRGAEILTVAASVFTSEERIALERSADPERAAVALWTRKEAYLKARGYGLSVEPRTIDLTGPDVLGDERAPLDGRRCRFEEATAHGCVITVCVATGGEDEQERPPVLAIKSESDALALCARAGRPPCID